MSEWVLVRTCKCCPHQPLADISISEWILKGFSENYMLESREDYRKRTTKAYGSWSNGTTTTTTRYYSISTA